MELLAPAGNMEKLHAALLYGADAVYLAGKRFGMRSFAGNFTPEELKQAVALAHRLGRKVYVALNIIPHNADLAQLPAALDAVAAAGADGAIVSDLGVLDEVKRRCPELPIHISTQANVTNWRTACLYRDLGASRVILSRELSLREIAELRDRTPRDLELECFVHGSMCVSYSGRCLLSNYLTGRSGNMGECAQPCRYRYALLEERTPGRFFPIEEDARGSYILNSMDLMMLPYLAQLRDAGIDSLKIEGRMKTVHYVSTIVRAYRLGLNLLDRGEPFDERLVDKVLEASHRPYGTGFFFGREAHIDEEKQMWRGTCQFIGLVTGYDAATGEVLVEQRNRFRAGDLLTVMRPDGPDFTWRVDGLRDGEGRPISDAKTPQMLVRIPYPEPLPPYTLLSRRLAD